MNFLENINFGLTRKLPVILQTENCECGLACIAMIAHFYGYQSDLFSLRQQFPISQKGATLNTLIKICQAIKLNTRPLRLELAELKELKTPCILHWELNHFVVLKSVNGNKITIIDPAFGLRILNIGEVSNYFTGIALEIWADNDFEKKEQKQKISLIGLFGNIKGLSKSLGQILILAVVLEIFALISPFFMQWVIDNAIVSADLNLLTTLVIGFGVLMFLTQLITLLQSWVVMYMATTLNIQWKANIFKHLINLPSEFFQKRHLGDIISRFGSIDSIQSTLTTSFITAILDGIMTVFTVILMFYYSSILALISVVAMLIYALLRAIWYLPLKRASEEQIIHSAKQNSHFMETMRGIRAIKRFNKQELRQHTWLSLFVNQINAGLYTQKLGLAFGFINGIIFGFENLIIIYLGASYVINETFTVGILMAFMAYKNQFGGRVSSLIDKFVQVKMLSLHSERLADIVLTETQKDELTLIENTLDNYDIEVNHLSFKYNDDEPYIFENLSFNIKQNTSVAIVGATGCGKSTLMSLLLGELTGNQGEIKMAGKIIKNMNDVNKLNCVACVSQDDVLFAGSLLDNISFFDENLDREWAENCAKMAFIYDEIMAMPMGFQTLVGDMGSEVVKNSEFLLHELYIKNPKFYFWTRQPVI